MVKRLRFQENRNARGREGARRVSAGFSSPRISP